MGHTTLCWYCWKEYRAQSNRQTHCSMECRLLDNIDQRGEGECWPWTSGRTAAGYGILTTKPGQENYAHRAMCRRVHGEPAEPGMYAMHSCDNPTCCNPAHLSWGTPKANLEDMYSKSRQGQRNYATGDRHGMRKKKLAKEASRGFV